jgi:hypothetical protein
VNAPEAASRYIVGLLGEAPPVHLTKQTLVLPSTLTPRIELERRSHLHRSFNGGLVESSSMRDSRFR